ncbi:MAG TPA: hypothetical protein VJL38_00250 [Patescibacteria group bacterium]|nr:hypothetical protein [Patescibacteria group bacterium]
MYHLRYLIALVAKQFSGHPIMPIGTIPDENRLSEGVSIPLRTALVADYAVNDLLRRLEAENALLAKELRSGACANPENAKIKIGENAVLIRMIEGNCAATLDKVVENGFSRKIPPA